MSEIGWLVELPDATWWTGDPDEGWTKDSLKAVRYPTEMAAHYAILEAGWTEARPTEHIWINPAEAALALAREGLEEARRAIGDHWAPNDCYATGPVTGNAIRDLVECPACSFIAMHDELLSTLDAAQVYASVKDGGEG